MARNRKQRRAEPVGRHADAAGRSGDGGQPKGGKGRRVLQFTIFSIAVGAAGLAAYTSITVDPSRGTMGTGELAHASASRPSGFLPMVPLAPKREDRLEPQTLNELIMTPPAERHRVGIARMNLLCASDMIGGDHLTPDAINHAEATIDRWAQRVKFETDRHLYRVHSPNPEYQALFGGSEAKFRAYMLLQVLQQDLGVRYDPAAEGNFSFANSSVAFLHGMVPLKGQALEDVPGGTCASMPVLYAAVGERLGYPLKLVTTKAHVFVRWDGENHANARWRDRFNIEGSGHGVEFFPDDYYRTWPKVSTPEEIEQEGWLKSFEANDMFSQFMMTRGHVWYDNRYYEHAARAYENAHRAAPEKASPVQWFMAAARRHPTYEAKSQHLADWLELSRVSRSRNTVASRSGPPVPMPMPGPSVLPNYPNIPSSNLPVAAPGFPHLQQP